MHSHMFLPLPEYHEHSWHFRLRKFYSEEMDETEMEMAAIRFERYAKLMAGQGFTHLVLDDQDYLPLFPAHPEIYPPESSFYIRHLAYRRLFRRLVDSARKYDLGFILFCQEIGYTNQTLNFFGEVCPENEKMWRLMEEKYDEIIGLFPEIDGYMFKVSDSLLSIDRLYFHQDLYRHECPACRTMTPLQRLKRFMARIHDCIVRKHGRELYYRTWDVNHGIHVDIAKHIELFDGIVGEHVYPMLKYTRGDFQLSNPFHPGIGGMKNQIVEYQFKLEHDGHGVLPLYIGGIHEQSLTENIGREIAGIWAWPSGGGRASINHITGFKGFTYFVEMNQFVFARKMMEPEIPHRELLALWGDGVLGKGNGKTLAEILCTLVDAFRLICNFGEFWNGSREYSKSAFHHGWFFDWQTFRHGGSDPVSGGENIRTRVLPHITDIESVIKRMYKGAGLFSVAREQFEREIVKAAGHEHEYHAFHEQFMAAEAFADLCAIWVEALLRFYGNGFRDGEKDSLLAKLEAAKLLYDRNYGVFVTQCMDYFLALTRGEIKRN